MNKKRILNLILAALIIVAMAFLATKGFLNILEDGSITLNTGNNVSEAAGNDAGNTAAPGNTSENTNTAPVPSGPVYFTEADLKKLTNTELFSSTAVEHIFLGSVNSKNKGSGYHYDMIENSPGKIDEATRSKEDKHGCYTANVTVNGYKKDHYSTFYPDSWTPQQVIDAIVEAREEALAKNQKSGSYYYGYSNGVRIELYLEGKDKKIVTAYPIYED